MLKDYLKSLLLAAVVSVIAVLCIPKEYMAYTIVSDEVKESGLLMGIDSWSAKFQELRGNTGMQSPEVYVNILDNKRLEKDGIRYSLSIKYQTITIEARDKDPLRATFKVDSIRKLLDNTIATKRREMGLESMKSAEKFMTSAKQKYLNNLAEYAKYSDSHTNLILEKYKAIDDSLKNEVSLAQKEYINSYNLYKRSEGLANMPYPSFVVLKSPVVPTSPIAPDGMHIFLTLSCICLVLTSWWNLWKYKKRINPKDTNINIFHLFAPWTINIAHWGLIMILFMIESDLLEPLSERFYISLTLWLLIFTFASLITFYVIPSKGNFSEVYNFNERIFNAFFIFALVLTPMHFYQIYKIAAMFDLSEIMYNIRMIATYGDTNFGILNYALVIDKALLVVALWQYPKISKWKLTAVYLLNVVSAISLMEKGTIFFMIFFSLFIFFEKRIIKVRTIMATSLILIAVFFVFTIGREYQKDSVEDATTFTDFFAIYILAGPVAYGRLFMDTASQFGARTFETVYLFLDRFGFGPFVLNDKVMDFVWVPLPTNTYTIFQPFFQDFGQKGIAFFAMVYGVIAGALYKLYKNGSSTCRNLYAYIAVALMLQFHQEEIFLSIVHVIQFTFFVVIFTTDKIKITLFKE